MYLCRYADSMPIYIVCLLESGPIECLFMLYACWKVGTSCGEVVLDFNARAPTSGVAFFCIA